MSKLSITAIVLTYNEEIHLQRCIDSLQNACEQIIVVDSFSTDKTKEIANECGVKFIQNSWVNYAHQFNWAIDNCDINTDWVLRLDADEYLSKELVDELHLKLNKLPKNISGITFPLRRVFLGKEIKRGTGGIKLLRLFKNGKGRSENRWMDEHIEITGGEIIDFIGSFSDDNLNDISWWTQKHIGYAIREAIDLLDIELGLFDEKSISGISGQASKKRSLKVKYASKPLFLRTFLYFMYRYIFKLGFTEGKEGFLWHFLQGWWYRTLVDVKIYEIKKACGNDTIAIKDYLNSRYNIKL